MVRLKNELNEYLIIGWDINSSNLCIYNYFNFSRLENIYACGTLINIFLLSLKGFKFLSLLNFTHPSDCLIFQLCVSSFFFHSLRIIGKKSFDISVSTIYIFAYLIFSVCYFLFFLRAKMQMFVFSLTPYIS